MILIITNINKITIIILKIIITLIPDKLNNITVTNEHKPITVSTNISCYNHC